LCERELNLNLPNAGLRDLTLDYCTFDPSPTSSPLYGSHLRRLTLSFLSGPVITSILASADLPLLQDLILLIKQSFADRRTVEFEDACCRYAARLTTFTLSFIDKAASFELSEAVWSSFATLEALKLDYDAPFDTILLPLSGQIASLRIRPHYHRGIHLGSLKSALESSPKCLGRLTRIVIPGPELDELEGDEDEDGDDSAAAARCSLLSLCQSRGFEVAERMPFELQQCLEFLEDALDPW
jgi:hypothetical protein